MYRFNPRFRSARCSRIVLLAAVAAGLSGCGEDASGPQAREVRLVAGGGAAQFGSPGQVLADSFAVLVVDATSGRPVDDITVRWRIVSGAGATLTAASTVSDGSGVARTLLRMGADTGAVVVEADADRRRGEIATFHARGVATPVLTTVAPLPAPAGGTVTLQGSNFSTRVEDNTVLFGGRRGIVRSATATSLSVEVPPCLPDRSVSVQVRLGAVASNAVATPIAGRTPGAPVLPIGGLLTFTGDDAASCIALDGTVGRSYLVVALNTDPEPGIGMPWQLTGLAGSAVTVTLPAPSLTPDVALEWEMNVRALERAWPPGPPPTALRAEAGARAAIPELGERTQFNVLNRQNRTDRITAEVRAITGRAIVYVDLDAPSGGFSQADLDRFGEMFDDPIYPTDVATFGGPSDIDANDRVVILLTPRVNALTARDENSFIAGFFYGCDLVERERCSDTNRAEIFYSMVPDPAGQFSAPRSLQTVLNTVPGVLAHEFQHMITFGRKGRLDLLWLSEGLAHMAEERVGRVFAERGDAATAAEFRRPNFTRARSYMLAPWRTSLTNEDSPGTLELRGAGWLFVQYLAAQYGGDDLLSRLTGATQLGAANVAAQTARGWDDVFTEFSVALWASGAPELAGVAYDPRLTFGSFDLRSAIAVGGTYPLRPEAIAFTDVTREGTQPQASPRHFLFTAQAGAVSPFTLSFAGRWGAPFESGSPRLAVLRVR